MGREHHSAFDRTDQSAFDRATTAKAEICREMNHSVQVLKALLRFLSSYLRLRGASIKSGLGLQLVLGPIGHFGLVKLQSSSVIALCRLCLQERNSLLLHPDCFLGLAPLGVGGS